MHGMVCLWVCGGMNGGPRTIPGRLGGVKTPFRVLRAGVGGESGLP